MKESDLLNKLKSMKTARELAFVLNAIKQNEFGKVRYNITSKMLKYYSSDSIAPKRFRTFHIHKKKVDYEKLKLLVGSWM